MYRIFKSSIIALTIFVLTNCGGNKNESGEGEFYSVDKANLGIEIDDKELGVVFSPPADWNLMPSSLSKKNESKGLHDGFVYVPVYVFFEQNSGGFLSAGRVVSLDSTMTKGSLLNFYKGLISNKYKNNKLSVGYYTKSKIAFTQFQYQKANLVSIKIIFFNSKYEVIQLDYSIVDSKLNKSLEKIKSSIGSIKLSN